MGIHERGSGFFAVFLFVVAKHVGAEPNSKVLGGRVLAHHPAPQTTKAMATGEGNYKLSIAIPVSPEISQNVVVRNIAIFENLGGSKIAPSSGLRPQALPGAVSEVTEASPLDKALADSKKLTQLLHIATSGAIDLDVNFEAEAREKSLLEKKLAYTQNASKQQLASMKKTVQTAQKDVTAFRTDLSHTAANLNTTSQQLEAVKSELKSARQSLNREQEEMDSMRLDIKSTRMELTFTRNLLNGTQKELNATDIIVAKDEKALLEQKHHENVLAKRVRRFRSSLNKTNVKMAKMHAETDKELRRLHSTLNTAKEQMDAMRTKDNQELRLLRSSLKVAQAKIAAVRVEEEKRNQSSLEKRLASLERRDQALTVAVTNQEIQTVYNSVKRSQSLSSKASEQDPTAGAVGETSAETEKHVVQAAESPALEADQTDQPAPVLAASHPSGTAVASAITTKRYQGGDPAAALRHDQEKQEEMRRETRRRLKTILDTPPGV